MVTFTELLVPILIASVAVFFWSFLAWMIFGHHNADVQRLPDEDAALGFLKDIPAGNYLVPAWQGIDRKDPDAMKAFNERYKQGPWAMLRVWPRQPMFAKNLVLTYAVFLVICSIVGYLLSATLPAGEDYLRVFRIAGAAGLLGFTFGGLANDVFFGKPTRFVITDLFDAICYTLIVAGVFAAMWPAGPELGTVGIPTP